MDTSPEEWNLKRLPGIVSRSPEEINVLWAADLPPDRDTNPALWDTLLGFFEDAAVAVSQRPGSLVVTPRTLLRHLKHGGREPSAGRAVIEELLRRGDILRADSLTLLPAGGKSATAGGIASTLSRYIFGSPPPAPLGLDDPIVPTAALEAAAARAKDMLGGPVSSDDIHTVQSFASEFTARNTRDAEAVISQLVSLRAATVLFTDVTPETKLPVAGFKFGTTPPNEADKGVLQTKAALQRMEDLAAHLEKSVALETAAATAAARSGNKADALARLRKKKLLDNKLAGARASVHKLTDVLMAVDEAASNKEAVQALEIGMESLRVAAANGVSAERVDAIAADYADHTADQEDVRVALQQLNQDPSGLNETAAEEAELAAMMAAEDVGHSITAPDPVVEGSAEEEAELAKIMAEFGIAKNDTADLPTPPSPSGRTPEKRKESASASQPNY
jgi:Snf7